jgi:peroxiredoxin
MMKKLLLSASVILFTAGSAIAATVGEPAPAFTATDTKGVEHSLSDFESRTVVLEWHNPECPYVVKHYESGNMQELQAEATAQNIVWITVNSGAEGKQGHMTAEQANATIEEAGSNATAYIIDAEGTIGEAYDAKTTPHMYVIDPEGTLVYQGAIDDDPSFKQDGIATATNYVRAAWQAVAAGETVETGTTQPYGCSVKY